MYTVISVMHQQFIIRYLWTGRVVRILLGQIEWTLGRPDAWETPRLDASAVTLKQFCSAWCWTQNRLNNGYHGSLIFVLVFLTHTRTYDPRAHAHTRTRTHTRTHALTRTRTHTRTHTLSLSPLFLQPISTKTNTIPTRLKILFFRSSGATNLQLTFLWPRTFPSRSKNGFSSFCKKMFWLPSIFLEL